MPAGVQRLLYDHVCGISSYRQLVYALGRRPSCHDTHRHTYVSFSLSLVILNFSRALSQDHKKFHLQHSTKCMGLFDRNVKIEYWLVQIVETVALALFPSFFRQKSLYSEFACWNWQFSSIFVKYVGEKFWKHRVQLCVEHQERLRKFA